MVPGPRAPADWSRAQVATVTAGSREQGAGSREKGEGSREQETERRVILYINSCYFPKKTFQVNKLLTDPV